MFPIFMWIKNYNGLKDLRINLDPNYEVELEFEDHALKEFEVTYQKSGKIKTKKNKRIKKIKIKKQRKNQNIYNKNIDSINVIVGKNGVGKSSILNLLSVENKKMRELTKDYDHLIIYKTNQEKLFGLEGYSCGLKGGYFEYIQGRKKIDMKLRETEGDFLFYINNDGIFQKEKEKEKKVLYGKFKSQEERSEYNEFENGGVRLKRCLKNFTEKKYFKLYQYIQREKTKKNFNNAKLKIEISYRELKININLNRDEKNTILEEDKLKEIITLYTKEDYRKSKDKILMNYSNEIFKYLIEKTLKKNKRVNLDSVKKECEKLEKELWKENLEKTLDFLVIKLEETNQEKYKLEKELIIEFSKELKSLGIEGSYKYIIEAFNQEKEKELMKKLDEMNNLEKRDIFLNIEITGFSDGELAYLNLFSSISSFIENEGRDYKNIILLIDEVETYLHPEWCRNVINELVKLLNEYKDKEFKLILATHSPFILSDIKKDYCILLEKDTNGKVVLSHPKNETFASNINDLLKDEFFLERTVGEFAISKIERVLDILKEEKISKEKEKEIRDIIDLIGDKIVKKLLLDKLNTKLSIKINKKDELLKIYRSLSDEEKECILGEINDKN